MWCKAPVTNVCSVCPLIIVVLKKTRKETWLAPYEKLHICTKLCSSVKGSIDIQFHENLIGHLLSLLLCVHACLHCNPGNIDGGRSLPRFFHLLYFFCIHCDSNIMWLTGYTVKEFISFQYIWIFLFNLICWWKRVYIWTVKLAWCKNSNPCKYTTQDFS